MVKRIVIFSMVFEVIILVAFFLICLSMFNMYREYTKNPVQLEQGGDYNDYSDGQHVILDSYQILSIAIEEKNSFTKYTYELSIINDLNETCGKVELVLNDNNDRELIDDLENYTNDVALNSPPVIDGYIINISRNNTEKVNDTSSDYHSAVIRVIPGECGMETISFIIRISIAFTISAIFQIVCVVQLRKIIRNQNKIIT